MSELNPELTAEFANEARPTWRLRLAAASAGAIFAALLASAQPETATGALADSGGPDGPTSEPINRVSATLTDG